MLLNTRRSTNGYWIVTYSVAPGVYFPVTLCDTGISADQAETLAAVVLDAHTGQKVMP